MDFGTGHPVWYSAARLRAKTIRFNGATTTVGHILSGEKHGASKYPNQIRYGCPFCSFPSQVYIETAGAVISFADKHWDNIRVKMKEINSVERIK